MTNAMNMVIKVRTFVLGSIGSVFEARMRDTNTSFFLSIIHFSHGHNSTHSEGPFMVLFQDDRNIRG
jgi:hypothetical protein